MHGNKINVWFKHYLMLQIIFGVWMMFSVVNKSLSYLYILFTSNLECTKSIGFSVVFSVGFPWVFRGVPVGFPWVLYKFFYEQRFFFS